jgi:hypothetical protein
VIIRKSIISRRWIIEFDGVYEGGECNDSMVQSDRILGQLEYRFRAKLVVVVVPKIVGRNYTFSMKLEIIGRG